MAIKKILFLKNDIFKLYFIYSMLLIAVFLESISQEDLGMKARSLDVLSKYFVFYLQFVH